MEKKVEKIVFVVMDLSGYLKWIFPTKIFLKKNLIYAIKTPNK